MQRTRFAAFLATSRSRSLAAFLAALLASPVLPAAGSSDSMAVVVVVPARASVAQAGGDSSLVITPDDVAGGSASCTVVYEVQASAGQGYALWFTPRQRLADSIDIRLEGAGATLVDEPVTMVHRDPAPRATLTVRYRLHLAAGVGPGTYPLPVHLIVEPL